MPWEGIKKPSWFLASKYVSKKGGDSDCLFDCVWYGVVKPTKIYSWSENDPAACSAGLLMLNCMV